MPNWCSNNFELTGSKEQIDAFENFLVTNEGDDWFDFFLPTPAELKETVSPNRDDEQSEILLEKYGASDWYSWNVTNWGTKWNCNAIDWLREENTIRFWFDSAWAPPIALYTFLESEGYSVRATYYEPGMGFVGYFAEGFDDCYEYSDLESLDDVPEHLVEEYNIRESLEEFFDGEENE